MNHYVENTTQMFCYETDALDFFPGLVGLTEEVDRINKTFRNENFRHAALMQLFAFVMFCAREISRKKPCSWEGDIRHHESDDPSISYESNAYIFSIPNPYLNTCVCGMIWKQDNNGTTFICSPVELPHLSDGALT